MWRIRAGPKQYCRDALKHFLIAGNTRVGSTWLETSLDLLSDVRCRREIRWKMSYQALLEIHAYIRASTTSMKEQIALACRVDDCTETNLPVAMGSKLKFDPYGFVDGAAFDGLARIIEQDVIVILLRRSYVDIFKTWKAIGIRHLLNERSVARIAQSDPVLIAAARRQSEPIAARHIDLLHDGRRLATSRWRSLGREAFDYPLEEAIADLLVFFCNDIRALQATAHVAERYVVSYREIGSRLHQIADVLGSVASPAEILAVLSDPVMQKIEAEDQVRVRPDGLLHALSVVLDDAFESCLQGKLRPDDLVAHSWEANVTTFRIPGLGCAIAALEERIGGRIQRAAGGCPDSCPIMRTIYMPEL